jgi:hypothetical protein
MGGDNPWARWGPPLVLSLLLLALALLGGLGLLP